MASSDRSASDRRSAARTSVIWNALDPVLVTGDLDVLDLGGGTGGFAVRVAELGHRVVVVDPSPDALAALSRRAVERGLSDRVSGQQGDASSLLDVADADSADLVLCHGVLEHVADPVAALASIAAVLRPGGTLSLLLSQRHAAVISRAMAGHFQQAHALLDADTSGEAPTGRGAGRRYTPDEARALVESAGFTVAAVHGVRVFTDLVPGAVLDLEPGATQALVDLEQAVAQRPEFLPLATQVHLLAHR